MTLYRFHFHLSMTFLEQEASEMDEIAGIIEEALLKESENKLAGGHE